MAQLLQVLPLLVLFALTMFSFGDSRQPLFRCVGLRARVSMAV